MNVEEITTLFGEVLEHISTQQACDWYGSGDEDDFQCTCAGCQAKGVLKHVGSWRLEITKTQAGLEDVEPVDTNQRGAGSYPDRLNWHARERRLVGALLGAVGQQRMENILARPVTISDWYAILSLIRWLGTNVGSAVLETAGWRYHRYKEDRETDPPLFDSALERWTHGLGWVAGITNSSLADKDGRLRELSAVALSAVQTVVDHLVLRSEKVNDSPRKAD